MPEAPIVPDFDSVASLREGLEAKRRFEDVDLYFRDGSTQLGELEARLGTLDGVPREHILSYNTGMSSVTDGIDIALHMAGTDRPVLACAAETYAQTKKYIEFFIRNKRAEVFYFNSGDFDSGAGDATLTVLERRQPDVIVAESIGNFVGVPVTDAERLFDWTRAADKQPNIVFDDTGPLSTGLPLKKLFTPEDKAFGVVSGTKSYIANSDLLGVGYTQNEEIYDWQRKLRRTRGSLPSPSHARFLMQALPESREAFDERNRTLFRVTGELAVQLAAAAPKDSGFVIRHPAVPSHENHELYEAAFPDGGAPFLYISHANLSQYDVAERLWSSEAVRAYARLGQSFGFEHTRIVADEDVGAVRISGGAETDAQALGKACVEALYINS